MTSYESTVSKLVVYTLLLVLALINECKASDSVEWQFLTKQNFSAQIRQNSHVLLFATLPWSGEARSLMKEVAHLVAVRQDKFSNLKLMFTHSNNERVLADAIGVSEETTVIYYHHSISYKYRGRLRAQHILSSVRYCMSLSPEELPFKSLSSLKDLKSFLETTDKAVLLLEFCGWTSNLLAKGKKNGTENAFRPEGDHFGSGFSQEANDMPMTVANNNQKKQGMENANFKCGIENGFTGYPWIPELSSVNDTTHIKETEKTDTGVLLSCTYEEFQQFDSYFSKFLTAVKEFSLPPERHKFAFVSEKSLLSFLGVGDPGTWSVMLHHNGCPTCSRVVKESDDLKSIIETDKPAVAELLGDGQTLEPAFPANKPSVLLAIDRSSGSSESISESKEALKQFRELALQYQSSYYISDHNSGKSEKASVQHYQSSNNFKHPKLKVSRTAQKIRLKDKMPIMIINEGQQFSIDNIASDLPVSSLNEILERILKHKNKAKLSALAEKAGFQLLSDDFDIKGLDTLPSNTDAQLSAQLSMEETHFPRNKDQDKAQPSYTGIISSEEAEIKSNSNDISASDHKEESENDTTSHGRHENDSQSYIGLSLAHKEDYEPSNRSSVDSRKESEPYILSARDQENAETNSIPSVEDSDNFQLSSELDKPHQETENVVVDPDKSEQSLSVKAGQYSADKFILSEVLKAGENKFLQVEKSLELPFEGSFFFSDGNYRLLEALTGGSKVPSLIIIDPVQQQHYVFSEGLNFSYASMSLFLERFLQGGLLPYQRSETHGQSHREAIHPPFVNLYFHEVESLPRMTANAFSWLVFGLNDTENVAQYSNDDILIIFSTTWCGFCQRMELLVREVYRSLKGYANVYKSRSTVGEVSFIHGNTKETALKIPLIYLMDCALNDCSFILKSIGQVEVYPALILFPAHTKKAISYEGDTTVAEIIKFIAAHGTNSRHLTNDNVILQNVPGVGGSQNSHKISKTAAPDDISFAEGKLYEVKVTNVPSERVQSDLPKSEERKPSYKSGLHVPPGSFLVATDNLTHVYPFEKSVILIVKAVQDAGFLGLIVNKHLKWDTINELEGLDILKEAPLTLGGPLVERGSPLMALSRRSGTEQHPEVLPGTFFLDQVATINEIEALKAGERSISDYWFFLGYSGWGWDQLYDEIALGAWELSNSDRRLEWP